MSSPPTNYDPTTVTVVTLSYGLLRVKHPIITDTQYKKGDRYALKPVAVSRSKQSRKLEAWCRCGVQRLLVKGTSLQRCF